MNWLLSIFSKQLQNTMHSWKCFRSKDRIIYLINLKVMMGFEGKVARFWRYGYASYIKYNRKIYHVTPDRGEMVLKEPLPLKKRNQFPKKHYWAKEKWSRGVPRKWLEDIWQFFLIVLHKYLTCEGCYNITFTYHILILQHFVLGKELNFPYFLLKSLRKMCRGVQKSTSNPKSNVFHHGLIKVLIVAELKSHWDTWDFFLNSR